MARRALKKPPRVQVRWTFFSVLLSGGDGPDGVSEQRRNRDGGWVEAAPDVVGDAGQGQELSPFPLPELVAGAPDEEDRPDDGKGSGGEVVGSGEAGGHGR